MKGAEEYSTILQEVNNDSEDDREEEEGWSSNNDSEDDREEDKGWSSNKDHAFRTMQKMREEDVLCDVTLLVGQEKVVKKAHRFLLSVFSEYFKTMFTSGLKESNQHIVHLPCVDAESFQLILDYIYDGEITLTRRNVHKLILLANFFGIENLANDCCCFINRRSAINNCIKMLEFSVKYDLTKLRERTLLYIADNLEEVQANNLDFAHLPPEFVFELVKHPRTTICDDPAESEKRLFMLLWNRVSSLDESDQREYFPKILKAVHLPVVKRDFLNQIEKKVVHSEEAKDLIEEAKKSVDVEETREWYLPRYKSSGPLTLQEHSVALTVNGEEYTYYSRCALIKGFPWYIYGKRIGSSPNRSTFYKILLESAVMIENLNLQHTILAGTDKNPRQNTYCKGISQKKILETSSPQQIVKVRFE